MPKTPSTGYAHQPFLWRVANANMIVHCRCRKCVKAQNYLASDLVEVFGPNAVVGELWGRCPRCGSVDRWTEQERVVLASDVGHTVIRRPNGFRKTRLWTNQYYGPPAYGPHRPFGPG